MIKLLAHKKLQQSFESELLLGMTRVIDVVFW